MRKLWLVALAGVAVGWTAVPDTAPEAPRTVIVEMVDKSPTEFVFQPAQVRVRRGDVVRFVQTGAMPHNVEFTGVPAGAELGASRMGPFLTARGQTYELTIDGRFVAGEYAYVCTPHVELGMRGSLEVVKEE